MMVNMNQLRSFYMAAKHGSVSIAAEKMFVTPPAVTMQIKKLESWLGYPLLKKEKNSLKITKEATQLYQYAEDIFLHVEQLELYLGQQAESKRNELFIGADHMIARFIAPRMITLLNKAHPHLKIKVVLANGPELIEKLLNHEIQFTLMPDIPLSQKIKSVPLFDEDMVLVAAKNSKFICNRKIEKRELAQLPFLRQTPDTNIYKRIKNYLDLANISPEITMDNLSGNVIQGLLLQDVGVAFVHRVTVQDPIDQDQLQEVEVIGGLPQSHFCLAFLDESIRAPHLHSLVSWLATTTFKRSHLI